MSVFRQSLPLLVTSFVNRCGTIGLSLLPMLLVEHHVSTASAATVMGCVKAAGFIGALVGGSLTDRFGTRAVVLLALALQGLGLGLLPWMPLLGLIALCGITARLGDALFKGPGRLLLAELVPDGSLQESVGWLRTTNNAGQIVSYGLGTAFAAFGVAPLMMFDALTSLSAVFVGAKLLPAQALHPRSSTTSPAGAEPPPGAINAAVWCALACGAFLLLFELFMVSAAARLREQLGDGGLRLFSIVMIINTAICALAGVWASRAIQRPLVAFPLGVALAGAGVLFAFSPGASSHRVLAGTFVLTLGEVVFSAIGGVSLVRLTAGRQRRGALYSGLLVVQEAGVIAGGALAFPLIVRGAHSGPIVGLMSAISVAVAVIAGRRTESVLEPKPVVVSAVPG